MEDTFGFLLKSLKNLKGFIQWTVPRQMIVYGITLSLLLLLASAKNCLAEKSAKAHAEHRVTFTVSDCETFFPLILILFQRICLFFLRLHFDRFESVCSMFYQRQRTKKRCLQKTIGQVQQSHFTHYFLHNFLLDASYRSSLTKPNLHTTKHTITRFVQRGNQLVVSLINSAETYVGKLSAIRLRFLGEQIKIYI